MKPQTEKQKTKVMRNAATRPTIEEYRRMVFEKIVKYLKET